jgi:hypothetical protein
MTPDLDTEDGYRHEMEKYGMLIPMQNLYEGQLALSEYFRKYRRTNLDKSGANGKTDSDPLAARDGYLDACATDFAIPEPLGIVRRRPRHDLQSKHTVDLSHFGVGSKATRLAAPLRHLHFVDSLKLRGNRLGHFEAVNIVQHLGRWVCHLDLANNAIGFDGASELGRVLSSPECGIQTLSLEGNNLGDRGVGPIAASLSTNKCLRRLCLRGNDIGSRGCLMLAAALCPAVCEYLAKKREALDAVDALAEKTGKTRGKSGGNAGQTSKKTAKMVQEAEKKADSTAETSDFALLCLSTAIPLEVASAEPNQILEELDLSWNRIGGEGATFLFRALMHYQFWFTTEDALEEEAANREAEAAQLAGPAAHHEWVPQKHPHLTGPMESCLVQDLDLSWNMVGKNEHAVSALVDMLAGNESLLRLDVSYNWFERPGLVRLGPGLSLNHTLLDFFVEGSCAFVDAEGYLHVRSQDLAGVAQDTEAARIAHIVPPSSQNNSWLDLNVTLNRRDKRWATSKNPGWIAGGWSEVTFEWSPGHHTDPTRFQDLEIDLRLSVDEFRPTRMKRRRAGGDVGLKGGNWIFTATRVMPPGDIVYFFTVEGERAKRAVMPSAEVEAEAEVKTPAKRKVKKRLWNLLQVMDVINCIYDGKYNADRADEMVGHQRDMLPSYINDWFEQEYGTVMKERKLGFFRYSVEHHKSKSMRIQWFAVFAGWDNEDGVPHFSDFETPYRANAIDEFIKLATHVFPENAIEESLRAEPCLVKIVHIVKLISEGPKHGGLFDLAFFKTAPYQHLLKTMYDNAPATNAAGRRLKKSDRLIDFDFATHFVMKAWFVRMAELDPKNTGTLSDAETSSSSSSSSSESESEGEDAGRHEHHQHHPLGLDALHKSGAFIAKNQPRVESSVKFVPPVVMPVSMCNYVFCEERVGPLLLTGAQPRRPLDEPAVHQVSFSSWRPSCSVFAPRHRVSDGRVFLDTQAVFARACLADLSRCRLDALLGPRELGELKAAMVERYNYVSKYIRIQMCRSGSPGSFHLDDLEAWAHDCKGLLVKKKNEGAGGEEEEHGAAFTMTDVQRAWWAVKKTSHDSIDDFQMTRAEFLELLVRISLDKHAPEYAAEGGKHGFAGDVHVAGDAFDTLCELQMEMRIGNMEVEDPDEFRVRALYCPETDTALRKRLDILKLCFASWAHEMGQRLTYEEFAQRFVRRAMRNPVTSEQFSVMSEQACRVAFAMSRMTVVDDQLHDSLGSRDASIVFTEFLECVAALSRDFYMAQRRAEEAESNKKMAGKDGAPSSPLYMQMMQDQDDEDDGDGSNRGRSSSMDEGGSKDAAHMTPLDQMLAEFIDHIVRPLVDEKSAKRRASVQARLRSIENSQVNFAESVQFALKLRADSIEHEKDEAEGGVGGGGGGGEGELTSAKAKTKSKKTKVHREHHHHHYYHDHVNDSVRMSRQKRRRRATMIKVSEFGKASGRVVRCTGMMAVEDLHGAVTLEKGALVWGLAESVFGSRAESSDAHDHFDTDEVRQLCFELDFQHLLNKQRFVNMIDLYDDEGGEDEINEVKAALWNCYGTAIDAFEYYSMVSDDPHVSHVLDAGAFRKFIQDCKIVDSNTCTMTVIDKIFELENAEETSSAELFGAPAADDIAEVDEEKGGGGGGGGGKDEQAAMNDANDDSALMRFEFIGCLARIAVEKYIKSGRMDDVSDAITALCEQNIDANLGPEAIHDSNDFRRDRLYMHAVDKVFVVHIEKLHHLFDRFGRADHGGEGNRMHMEEWLNFIEAAGLYGDDFEVREAKLAFGWAQMTVVDEVNNRPKFTSMDFCDFLEALARICDLKALPTDMELKKEGVANPALFFESLEEAGMLPGFFETHPSEWNSKKTRTIAEKLPKLLAFIFYKLHKAGVVIH